MKTLVFSSSFPIYEWELREEDFEREEFNDIKEFKTLEDILELQEKCKGSSLIIKKPFGKFNDYCDMIIEIYDDYRE
jgi:hypothetical protein